MLSRERGQENFIKNLNKFNKFIITDLPPAHIKHIFPILSNKDVFYTDHHPSSDKVPKNILELRTTDQGYIPSSRTAFELTELDEWKAVAGTISDAGHKYKENDEFLNKFLKKEKVTFNKFLKEVVFTFNKLSAYNHKRPQKMFELLLKLKTYKDLYKLKRKTRQVEHEIQKHIKMFQKKREKYGKINFYFFNPKYPIKTSVISTLSFKSPKSTFIFAVPKGNQIGISARSQSDKIKVNDLLQKCTEGFKDSSAGGHNRASGARFRRQDLKKFKQNLQEYSKKLKS
jgi:single-stranded DNA-specific DHH superfamily exonuclease